MRAGGIMNGCCLCNQAFNAYLPGRSPKSMWIYQAEKLPVHESCGRRLAVKIEELVNEDAQQAFMGPILRRISH